MTTPGGEDLMSFYLTKQELYRAKRMAWLAEIGVPIPARRKRIRPDPGELDALDTENG